MNVTPREVPNWAWILIALIIGIPVAVTIINTINGGNNPNSQTIVQTQVALALTQTQISIIAVPSQPAPSTTIPTEIIPSATSNSPSQRELPTSTHTPTSIAVVTTQAPTATTIPTTIPQKIQVSLPDITIPGNSNRGVQFPAPQTGTYRFTYKEGAYSTYPTGTSSPDGKTWLTAIRVYSGTTAKWNGNAVSENALRIADNSYFTTEQDAVAAAQGNSLDIHLNAGETITLIAVDDQSFYGGNPGSVTVTVLLIPE